MHITQTLVGGAVLGGMLTGLFSFVAPAPAPIVVHSLKYEDGVITQDRTVTTGAPWLATWKAEIVEYSTGDVVRGCKGDGVWTYTAGRISPSFSLQEWVGSLSCELQPGTYFPRVTYWGGTDKIVARGDVFVIGGE